MQASPEALQGIGLLALDEAYVSFVEDRLGLHAATVAGQRRPATLDDQGLYALTGLRLGYMLASEEIVGRVRSFQYSWSVNAPAQAAGIAAIADREQVQKGREAVREGKEYLLNTARFAGAGVRPIIHAGERRQLFAAESWPRRRNCVGNC